MDAPAIVWACLLAFLALSIFALAYVIYATAAPLRELHRNMVAASDRLVQAQRLLAAAMAASPMTWATSIGQSLLSRHTADPKSVE